MGNTLSPSEIPPVTASQTTASDTESVERLYADGHPFDEVHYIEAKIILQGLRFVSIQDFFAFAKIVAKVAKREGVGFDPEACRTGRPQIREVLFFDTADFDLYRNAFILRRRLNYVDGFPVGEPELVFKFRHPDRETAAALDVRPRIPGSYKVKFKEENLPLKNRMGGVRSLFSHNVQFPFRPQGFVNLSAPETLTRVFPALVPLFADKSQHVKLVNKTAVEEVLLDLGPLDFGKGMVAPCNVSLWRTRGEQFHLVGEFSYQVRYARYSDLNPKSLQRSDAFFKALQLEAQDWVELGTTKTASVYHLKGATPASHE